MQLGIGVGEIRNLCSAIISSTLFSENKRYICSRYQYVLRINHEGSRWIRINSDNKILSLPASPHNNPSRPWETLPHLSDLEDEFVFVQKDAPHLTIGAVPQWDEATLLTVLNFDPVKVFSSQSFVNYLNLFLQNESTSPFLKILSIQKQLKVLIRQGFSRLGQKMSQVTKGIQEFMSFVLPEHRYVFKSDAHGVIRILQKVDSDFLILHKEFDSPILPGKAQLTVDESLRFLETLDQQVRNCELNDNKNLLTNAG